MTLDSQKLLDRVGWQILEALQEEARLSYAELGRRVGLSLPAVAERVRRMEEAGMINGYQAKVNMVDIGLPLTAFVHLRTGQDRYPALITLLKSLPQVLEAHHLAGPDAFIIKIVAASIPHLEGLITRLGVYGQTTTSIVLSSPITSRTLTAASGQEEGL